MKRFSILCCLVLLLNVLCPVGHVHAEDITTPTDLCDHLAACNGDSYTCKYCGYVSQYKLDSVHNWSITASSDGKNHIGTCTVCGENYEMAHWAFCDEPTFCPECGYVGTINTIEHTGSSEWVSFGEEGCGYYCINCEEKYVTEHMAHCDDPTHCASCGYESEDLYVLHDTYQTVSDGADGCHWKCPGCGYISETEAHYALCDNPNVCTKCGYEGEIEVSHYFPNGYGVWDNNDETDHWYICAKCHETRKMPHAGGKCSEETSTCTACGATYTHPHTWGNPVVVEATCTTAGSKTYTCTECGTNKVEVVPATGHTYGYWADGDNCVYGCLDCKQERWRDEHYAACDDPTRCEYCGCEDEFLYVCHRFNYVSDGAAGHHGVCETCGLVEETWEHDASCTNPTHCSACGYEGEIGNITHLYNEWVSFGAEGCGYICIDCGYKYVQNHLGRCDDSTHCLICDYEGECTSISHDYDWSTGISDGAKSHHIVCLNCGQERVSAHYASCDNPNVCSMCGYEGEIATIIHDWFDYVSDGVAGHHAICNTCGYVGETWEHRANCYNPTHCTYCDYEGEIESLTHVGETFVSYGEEGCGYICTKCGYKHIQDHQAFCADNTPNVCDLCGYKGEIPVIYHTFSGIMDGYDDTNHWYTCLVCGEIITVKHIWGTPVSDGNKTTYTCQVCNATKIEGASIPTAEPTTEPTAEPTVTATPTPDLDYEPDETATPAPTKEPEAQPTVAPTAEPAHTHSYGACVSNGSGSHTQTCADCGDTVNVACTMVDTKIGNLDTAACIYCGYITWKLGAVTDDAQGESLQEDTQEAKVIENAVFELVDEAGESIVTENMSLTVYESAPEVTIQLDTGASVVVKKALTITVLEDSTPVKLANTVKLSIPVEDNITGLKLLVMDENGELVEIAYEVVDGVMVFETDILGIFMLVEEI